MTAKELPPTSFEVAQAIRDALRHTKDRSRSTIYFVLSGEYVKVGYATRLGPRLSSMRSLNPHGVKLLGTAPGGRAREAAIHDVLAFAHSSHEWFYATTPVVKGIELALNAAVPMIVDPYAAACGVRSPIPL